MGGAPDPICPECGEPIDPEELLLALPGADWGGRLVHEECA